MTSKPTVNSWTEWGPLEEVIVGRAEYACYLKEQSELKKWPYSPGYYPKELIDELDSQLNGLIAVLQAESIEVTQADGVVKSTVVNQNDQSLQSKQESRVINKLSTMVKRPEIFDYNSPIKSPTWEMISMGNSCNPRDVVITMGNTILEAPMCWRSRFYEYLPYRKLIKEYWHSDNRILWKAVPKPGMDDDSYDKGYQNLSDEERVKWNHDKLSFNLTECDPAFDAADILRCGKDIFVNHGYMSNNSGIEWLRREFGDRVRVNELHFLDDPHSIHIDSTLVPLRPPKGIHGTEGLAMFNPDRVPLEIEMKLWNDNNWRLIPAPSPVTPRRKNQLTSSWTFNMNLLCLGNDRIVMNSTELPTYNLLIDLGFEVITCQFDVMTEFGGGIHCATWDIRRDDQCQDFFPDRTNAVSLKDVDQSYRYAKVHKGHPFCAPIQM